MSDYTYGLKTLAEYTNRAEQEVQRLETLEDKPLPDDQVNEVISAATQANLTIWHITDFAFTSGDPAAVSARTKIGGKDLKDFQARVRAASPAMTMCWELANGGKHFGKKPAAQVQDTTISVAASHFGILSTLFQPKARKRRAKVILPNGQRLRASAVFRDALSQWKGMI